MLDQNAFLIVAPLVVIASIMIFVQKKIIYSVLSLTAVFLGSAVVFYLLGQTFIAILQLIIFVGGLSTYVMVAVATEEKNLKMISLPFFFIIAIIFFAGLALILNYLPGQNPAAANPNFLVTAASALQSDYVLLYLMVLLLFAVTIGGTLVIKRFSRLIV